MHRHVKITAVAKETGSVTTLMFGDKTPAAAGQFVMAWLPGVDEIPMSLSYLGNTKGLTVNNIGDATAALCGMKKGDILAIRGPFGNGFRFGKERRILAVGGGVGMAPLAPAVETAAGFGKAVTVAVGARRADELLFVRRMRKCSEVHIATDDGTDGHHGFVTDLAGVLLKKGKFDLVITCGPEIMMKKVFELAKKAKVPAQASVERYMKCGIGLCDSCSMDGLLVCRDGPVFSDRQLAGTDFGQCWRDACGRKIAPR